MFLFLITFSSCFIFSLRFLRFFHLLASFFYSRFLRSTLPSLLSFEALSALFNLRLSIFSYILEATQFSLRDSNLFLQFVYMCFKKKVLSIMKTHGPYETTNHLMSLRLFNVASICLLHISMLWIRNVSKENTRI